MQAQSFAPTFVNGIRDTMDAHCVWFAGQFKVCSGTRL